MSLPDALTRGAAQTRVRMFSCIFAYAKGVETQSALVEFSDPFAVLFLARNDARARASLGAWLALGAVDGSSAVANTRGPTHTSAAAPRKAA